MNQKTSHNLNILITEPSADYALLDSGDSEKFERFGPYTLVRPDPQALWPKGLADKEWKKADGTYTREDKNGSWSLKASMPAKWHISLAELKFVIKPTAFKHTGLFPEQVPNWEWMGDNIKKQKSKSKNQDIEVLNLFGYTGGATLACAKAGAKVVHIDGSKAAVAWARENAELSGLADKPIRWIVEDARIFVEREIKRGRKYDAIIMDPPAFGHGPSSELWKIEDHFLKLVQDCKKLLKDQPLFFLINGYSAGYSAVAYENNLLDLKVKYGGEVEIGELAIAEIRNPKSEILDKSKAQNTESKFVQVPRLLPAGIYARWSV